MNEKQAKDAMNAKVKVSAFDQSVNTRGTIIEVDRDMDGEWYATVRSESGTAFYFNLEDVYLV